MSEREAAIREHVLQGNGVSVDDSLYLLDFLDTTRTELADAETRLHQCRLIHREYVAKFEAIQDILGREIHG